MATGGYQPVDLTDDRQGKLGSQQYRARAPPLRYALASPSRDL